MLTLNFIALYICYELYIISILSVLFYYSLTRLCLMLQAPQGQCSWGLMGFLPTEILAGSLRAQFVD